MTTIVCHNRILMADRGTVSTCGSPSFFFSASKLHIDASGRFAFAMSGRLPPNAKEWKKLSAWVEQTLLNHFAGEKQELEKEMKDYLEDSGIAILTRSGRYAINDGVFHVPHENEPIFYGTGGNYALMAWADGMTVPKMFHFAVKQDTYSREGEFDRVNAMALKKWEAEDNA